MAAPNGYVAIFDNATGCFNQEEVEEACKASAVQEKNFNSEFSISPNPATNKISIKNKNGLIVEKLNIYNQHGQNILIENKVTNPIDISNLQAGLYIIEIVTTDLSLRTRVIVR